MGDKILTVLGAIATVVIIVAGVMYIAENVHCFNFFGLAKGLSLIHI